MSRILLLLLFVFWMAWKSATDLPAPQGDRLRGSVTFVSFYALLVLVMGLWSRLLAQRIAADNFRRSLRRYNHTLLFARAMIPAWFGIGVFALGWGGVVQGVLGTRLTREFELPGLLLGIFPAVCAWMGLWWSQYPADRALREQNMLPQLEAGLPVHAAPSFRHYFFSNLRLQVLFTVVPVLMIVFVRDVFAALVPARYWQQAPESLDAGSMLVAAALVFVFAPEILRRVLNTQPLEDGPLRRRLEAMCRRYRLGYRDILLWKTHHNMGNAAVMGLLPRMRYILLSDLLLERMTDEQIEAVFAHEVGHVVHRHMAWYVVFFVILVLAGFGAEHWLKPPVGATDVGTIVPVLPPWLSAMGLMASFLIVFGYLSRRFERQADVFAARAMEAARNEQLATVASTQMAPSAPSSYVGSYGAAVFASALQRVATMNNIPITPPGRLRGSLTRRLSDVIERMSDAAHNWFHGSILHRMEYLQGLSRDPALTGRFDRVMARLYGALLLLLIASAATAALTLVSPS